jgi:RimJ/RimL family protein N-acetyltransferase
MQFASENLKLQTIVGITLPENLSSIKLLKKLGLSEVGIYTYEDGEELLLFSN